MDAKELLLQYDNYVRHEKRLKSEILWTRRKLDSLDRITTQTTPQMKKDRAEIEEKLIVWKKRLVDVSEAKRMIFDLISDIPGDEGEVLTRRYVNGEIWEEISDGIHFSWSGVFRIHDRALQMVQDRLDQGLFSL